MSDNTTQDIVSTPQRPAWGGSDSIDMRFNTHANPKILDSNGLEILRRAIIVLDKNIDLAIDNYYISVESEEFDRNIITALSQTSALNPNYQYSDIFGHYRTNIIDDADSDKNKHFDKLRYSDLLINFATGNNKPIEIRAEALDKIVGPAVLKITNKDMLTTLINSDDYNRVKEGQAILNIAGYEIPIDGIASEQSNAAINDMYPQPKAGNTLDIPFLNLTH